MPGFKKEIEHAKIGDVYEGSPVGKEALRLGIKVVDKLVEFKVPSQTLWVPESLYIFPDHASTRNPGAGRYAMHCVDSGQAWQITEEMRQQGDSTIVASRTAIDDQGRVFKKWVEADDTAVHDGQPIEGIINPRYIDPSQAIEEFESEAFEAGVISLLGKRGIRRTVVDLSPRSREVSAKTAPKSNEPSRVALEEDVLAVLIHKQTEADDAKAKAEARLLAGLQGQIDQLAAEYQQIHASTLERMRHLPATDSRWQLLTLGDGTQLPAMVYHKNVYSDSEYGTETRLDYITYKGDIYSDDYGRGIMHVDPMKSTNDVLEVQMRNTIRSHTEELKRLQKFHDTLPSMRHFPKNGS